MVVRMLAFPVGAGRAGNFAGFVRRRSAASEAVMSVRRMVVQRMNGCCRQQVADDREDDRNPSYADHHTDFSAHSPYGDWLPLHLDSQEK